MDSKQAWIKQTECCLHGSSKLGHYRPLHYYGRFGWTERWQFFNALL